MKAAPRVVVAAEAASAKARDRAVVIDVGDLLAITDYFVIVSGSNERHVRAIAEEVERRVKSEGGGSPRCVEGRDDARWILMDYGDYVVHVFGEEARAYYDLERLWGDAPRLAWDGSTPGHLAAESGPPGDGRRLAGSGAAEDESPVAGNGTGVGREPAGLSS